jgi:hypothetical protein
MRERRKYRHYKQSRNKRRKMIGTGPSLSTLVSLASAARAEEDETVKGLLWAVQYTQDEEIAQDTAEYLSARALKQILEPDPYHPPVDAEQASGELTVGRVRNSECSFGLWRPELVQGTYVAGRIGSGKTTFIRRLLKQLILLASSITLMVKIMVFDIKGDYKNLSVQFPEVWWFKLPGEDFRWNPLEPPIKNYWQWAGILSPVFSNSVGFYGGMSTENLLYKYLLELYHRYDTEHGIYPCLFDLRDYLKWIEVTKKVNPRSEEYRWFVRIQNRVESLCNAFGKTVECSCGYPLAEVLGHNVIFDMRALKQDAQSFFTECLLTQIICHRMESEERGGELRTLAVFDEAKRLMPKYREENQHAISNMSTCLAIGREFGIGFIVAECHPALLADSAKSSCYTRVCFNQTHGKDIEDSIKSLGIFDPDQAAEIHNLEVGEGIVRLSGRIKRPFVLQVTP